MKLPNSIKAAAAELAREEGDSLNQFIAAAVAEKAGVLRASAEFLRERAGDARPEDLLRYVRAAPPPPLVADERGMRSYVFVVLKTGPTPVPNGEQRTQMFAGHMANIKRLTDEKKLVFAAPDIATVKGYVATDPVIINGEMIAEYHVLYGSAGLRLLEGIDRKIAKASP